MSDSCALSGVACTLGFCKVHCSAHLQLVRSLMCTGAAGSPCTTVQSCLYTANHTLCTACSMHC